jgi:molybdopterin-guanine dinucleotide biosynthesis protein MobB
MTATDPSLIAWIRLTVDKILFCCFIIWGGDKDSLVISLTWLSGIKHKQYYELSSCMSTPAIFGIYGNSDMGKTTLIEHLVSQLTKEGYIVATVKQTKKAISLDTMNKDTWRYHNVGAGLVVFSSQCETDFLLYKTFGFSEIIERISSFGCYDVILVEGANDSNIPKIQLGTGKKRNNTVASYEGNIKEILILIKGELKKKPLLQHLNISVNGKNIPLTKFPEQIIINTIIGMLSSLKGVQDINEFILELKRKK